MADSARIEDLRKRYHENPRRFFAPLANEYRKSGFLDRALLLCEKHLGEQPDNLNGLVVYGQTLYEADRAADAQMPFERALALDPENLIALRHLGDIARVTDRPDDARHWYGRVLELDRRNDEVQALLADLGGAAEPTSAPEPRSGPSVPPIGPGSTKVIDVASLLKQDRAEAEQASAVTQPVPAVRTPTPPATPIASTLLDLEPTALTVDATPPDLAAPQTPPATRAVTPPRVPAAPPPRRTSLLDIDLSFDEEPLSLGANPPAAPAEPARPQEVPEATAADGDDDLLDISDLTIEAPPDGERLSPPTPPAGVPAAASGAGMEGLELAEFSSEVSPLAGLEATEFESGEVAALADLDRPDVSLTEVAALEGLDRTDITIEDVAPLAGLDSTEFTVEDVAPLAELAPPVVAVEDVAPLAELGPPDVPVEDVAPLAELGPPDVPAEDVAPLAELGPPDLPVEDVGTPTSSPSVSQRPRMTKADLASLPLLADFGLEDDEPAPAPRQPSRTPGFVTETMATVYLEQGFRDRAIDVYRQLVAQAPDDRVLRERLEQLEREAAEMPEFEPPSVEREPEVAPAGAALDAVSFADVGLRTPKDATPTPAATPLVTPLATPSLPPVPAGPTAREFFGMFARRGLARTAATPGGTPAAEPSARLSVASAAFSSHTGAYGAVDASPYTELPSVKLPLVDAASAEPPSVSAPGAWPLDALFGAAQDVRDLAAAENLAGIATFEGPSGETGLDGLFGEDGTPGRKSVPRASQSLKFDQFFTPPSTPAAEEPESAPAPGDDDLDQFNDWLSGLKP